MPGLDDGTNLFGNADGCSTLTVLQATRVELSLVCCAVGNQGCAGPRFPLQSKHFAGTRSTEHADVHQAQVMQVFDSSDERQNLLLRHQRFLDWLSLRHACILCRILLQEVELLGHAAYGTHVYEAVTNHRIRVMLCQIVQPHLNLKGSELPKEKMTEMRNQVVLDLERIRLLVGWAPFSPS